ncbi:SPFH domain-containing protein [Pediococcus claussenii]|uniref:SPFH domain / Band 7 family protein n=1 Tax=Pediococcus claussenii (strain ATCC BAA-344 / DSM 14800 / JCM 18046 / KCTC 3811 / LMG 21948 / P06) TaxID=701521 RepID=G8PCP6_PEDCP|nr:SPFH domain-containing protein [Pediococcus claussenii]AEV95031.1 SPFH domain / Band 7 family protein [Pediococcus claussenii ATCC BAA-344]ANZ70220.1 paraslipin [Pediococcus claussenii]ANZ72036.1 paraslipin [Pediococcus claussenii]KRN19167.1 hypothetical protein IV79_GL001539 [Pediococcus claussenii]
MGITLTIILVVLLILIIYILFRSFVIVHSGEVKLLERFGNFVQTLQPGLHLVIPIIYGVRETVSLRQTPLQIPPFQVITKENATVEIDVSLKYHVTDVEKYVYKNENSERSVVLDCQSNLRGIIGNKELNEVLNGTETINTDLFNSIKDITNGYGVAVDRINIGQLKANSEVQAAMDKLLTANRNKEAMITSAEGDKESMKLKAEGEASQVEIAARAEANRIAKIAQANADRIKLVNGAVKESGLNAEMMQYIGLQTFGQLANGVNNTVVVPSNMTELGNIPAAKKLWDTEK